MRTAANPPRPNSLYRVGADQLSASPFPASDSAAQPELGENELQALGARVRQMREAKGWSMKLLAEASRVSLPALQRMEVGASSASLATAMALCKALGQPLEQLVCGTRHELLSRKFNHVAMPKWPSQAFDLTGAIADAYLQSRIAVIRAGASQPLGAGQAAGAMFAFVLVGELRVVFADGESQMLSAGDALHLWMPEDMEWRNAGKDDAQVLCIVDDREGGEAPASSKYHGPEIPDDTSIGQRIKALRAAKEMNLSSLAHAAKVPASTISKIENGKARPSLVQAIRIAETLDANLAFLAGKHRHRPQRRSLVRAADRQSIRYPELDLTLEDLSGSFFAGVLESRLGLLEPGAHSGLQHMVHAGDELCFVIEGAIRFRFDTGSEVDTVELVARECLQFKSDTPHWWVNAHHGPTRVLWVFSDGLSF